MSTSYFSYNLDFTVGEPVRLSGYVKKESEMTGAKIGFRLVQNGAANPYSVGLCLDTLVTKAVPCDPKMGNPASATCYFLECTDILPSGFPTESTYTPEFVYQAVCVAGTRNCRSDVNTGSGKVSITVPKSLSSAIPSKTVDPNPVPSDTTSSAPKPTDSNSSSGSKSGSGQDGGSSGIPGAAIGGIVAGIVVILGVVGFVLYRKFVVDRNRKREDTDILFKSQIRVGEVIPASTTKNLPPVPSATSPVPPPVAASMGSTIATPPSASMATTAVSQPENIPPPVNSSPARAISPAVETRPQAVSPPPSVPSSPPMNPLPHPGQAISPVPQGYPQVDPNAMAAAAAAAHYQQQAAAAAHYQQQAAAAAAYSGAYGYGYGNQAAYGGYGYDASAAQYPGYYDEQGAYHYFNQTDPNYQQYAAAYGANPQMHGTPAPPPNR
ncbi:hypothetical protein HDU97_000251 [Phlyctochytrium planicorne]|nr:hypothetical protein HDU97_000251 [Phlyctochytrium planicorne]